MPMGNDFKIKIPEAKVVEPIPADVYQLVITDVNLEEKPNPYENNEITQRLNFKLSVLDEGYEDKLLQVWVANKWFINSKSHIASGLYKLADAVFAGYGTKVDMEFGLSLNPNDLIGKQVRATVVQVDKEGKTFNKITSYMPIKKEIPVSKKIGR